MVELGANLAAFPTEKHFVGWLKLAPRTPMSAGKLLKKKSRGLGSTRVAQVLRMAAQSLKRSKTALGAEFRRLARRRGWTVAIFAIARELACYVHRMLRFGQDYVDIGEQAHEEKHRVWRLAGLTRAAYSLGYALVAQPAPDAPAA